MENSPLAKLETESFHEQRQTQAPPATLSEALSPSYLPKKLPHKKLQPARLGTLIKGVYNKAISGLKQPIIDQRIRDKNYFMEEGTRESIENVINHEEWRTFKKALFEKKEGARLLAAEVKNPLNYLPENHSEQAIRFRLHQKAERDLLSLQIDQLMIQQKPNLELAALLNPESATPPSDLTTLPA